MKIAIIVGSVREGRYSHRVCYYLKERLEAQARCEVQLLDLAEIDLPLLTNLWEEQEEPADNLVQFSQYIREADALIFASPEYHGSYSGVLKNAIDHYWKEFNQKPIGVVAAASGPHGGINASIHMQQLILSLGAFAMPQKLLVPFIRESFDNQNQPLNEDVQRRIDKFIKAYLWFADAIVSAKKKVSISAG